MNFREKFVIQVVVSMMIFSFVKSADMFNLQLSDKVRTYSEKHYTAKEIKDKASGIFDKAGSLHEQFTSAVIQVSSRGFDETPLGEKDDNGICVVYAPAGGKVVSSGISKEHGMFVRIKHDEKYSLYGNLLDIVVLTGERVRKGDIIGSYDSTSGNEFIYELTDIDFSDKI